MEFREKYNLIKILAKDEIESIENSMITDIHTREPLKSSLIQFLTSPAKRIRPLLAILYTKANNEELSEEQIELLTVMELVHNASLIHDDIIDESKIRRNHKTVSAEFDNKLAVISGDYILSIAMEKLAKLNNIEIIKNLITTIKHMCIGEINQNFNRFKLGTLEDYLEKTKCKTAYLFESTLVCCMMLSKKEYNLEKIGKFSLDVGIAFQIRDDLINMTKSDTSKPVDNDYKEGIYNAPIILGNPQDNYQSGIEKTRSLLNNYLSSAKKHIQDLPSNEYKIALEKFLELLYDV